MTRWMSALVALCLLSGPASLRAAEEAAKVEEKPAAEAAAGEKEAAAPVANGTLSCTKGGDKRTLTVTDGEDGGKKLVYNKSGEDNVVAEAKNDMSYLDKVREKISSNLVSAGFDCK